MSIPNTQHHIADTNASSDIDIEGEIIQAARRILAGRFAPGVELTSPRETKDYFMLHFERYEREVFGCLFLSTRHRVIAMENIFYGTIDGASVHAREVVKRALFHNAAAVILSHNHPSGSPEPSRADQTITDRLKEALSLVDVRVLDHIVVGGSEAVSMAERGMV